MEDTSLEDVAAFKQHLISGQVAPIKLEHGLDSDLQIKCKESYINVIR